MFDIPRRLSSSSTLPLIRLRPAVPRDIPALTRLIHQSMRELGKAYYTSRQIESVLKYGIHVEPQMVRDGTLYVIDVGGQLVASGGWSRRDTLVPGKKPVLLNPALHPAKAQTFYVHPAWTHRGLAKWLLEESLAAAKAAGFQQIELLATKMGEPLYLKFGFREVESFTFTLPDGVVFPAKRMVKDLADVQ